MIQDAVRICPKCKGALRKQVNMDTWFICLDLQCKTVLKVVGFGQSERELECEVMND